MPKNVFFLGLIIFSSISINALADDSLKINKPKLSAFPIFFYSPDTKFGIGAAGLLTFNFKNDSIGARRSSVTFGFAYTQLKQVLIYLPYQLFLKNRKYWLYGEVGYFRYVFNYFGTGNEFPVDYLEKYDADFPRLRINALRKIKSNVYGGIRYVYDDFKVSLRDTSASLATDKPSGFNGGRVSGLGVLLNYDSRDNIFFPSKGVLLETMLYGENSLTGSQFEYSRISFDLSTYFSFFKNHVLAVNGVGIFMTGDVPFHQMAVIGGTKKLRGYFEGKYRDKNLMLLQVEYRAPLFWRMGLVGFGGYGVVADKLSNTSIQNFRYNYGAGLRFLLDKKQKINIRMDYGLGYKSSGFYLTITEAF